MAQAYANGTLLTTNKSIFEVVMLEGGSLTVNNNISLGAVSMSGTLGSDFSANKPTLPNTFQAFAASGPYASYVLVANVAANTSRNNIDIENNSGAQIVIIRDDGTSANNVALVNATAFPLSGGTGVGSQGGSWSSQTFKGRIQVYAANTSAQIAVMVD